jgi:hypothetical protein
MSENTLEPHPTAEIFPMLDQDELDALAADIKGHGLRELITLYEGKILDGRNRYQACLGAGIEPRFEEFTGADPVAFVISKNIRRRHLTPDKKREIVETLLRSDPSRSDRQIARDANVDHKTVGAVRSNLEDVGKIPTSTVRTDTKGRKQPTRPRAGGPIKKSVSGTKPSKPPAMSAEQTFSKVVDPMGLEGIVEVYFHLTNDHKTEFVRRVGLLDLFHAAPHEQKTQLVDKIRTDDKQAHTAPH